MSHKTNRKNTPPVKPVQKIELKDKNNKGRLALVILLLIIGIGAMGYGLMGLLTTEKGWREIKANNTQEMNCSNDFIFMYNIGASDISPTAENKALTNFYTDATVDAYKIFTSDEGFEDIDNIYTMNQNPNKELEVDKALYEAFELLQEYGNRYIYLAPVYAQYDDMFFSTDESEIGSYDPYSNKEVADYYAEIAAYANNPEKVEVKLLGDNKVMLYVAEDYLQYANENGIERFVDLFWMKNAFVTDYLSDVITGKGYTHGTISSRDGFSRNLNEDELDYSFKIYDTVDGEIYQAGIVSYKGKQSSVYLRDFIMDEYDRPHYYELKNGEVRTSYLDIKDGMCKSAVNTMISYSKEKGCAEVLLSIMPIYIAETLDEQALVDLLSEDVYSIYCKDSVIYYNNSDVIISDLYDIDQIHYTLSLMGQ